MCGIAGIVDLNGTIRELPRHIKAMTDTIRHRGPDGEGFLLLGDSENITAFGTDTPGPVTAAAFNYAPQISIDNVPGEKFRFALGHRRLSIIDVSPSGHQPMCDTGKNAWIIFNGEIYNHIELRDELHQKGITFHTHTDTEVVIQSYLHWGEDCVNHFNGMWSFVLYDTRKNCLFGSRDRVGVKPFYYFKNEQVFAFASEQKALVKLPFVKTGINPKAAAEFLTGDIQYIERGEENMFRNVVELMPAQNFRIDLRTGSLQKWSYYTLKTSASYSDFSEARFLKYRDETEAKLVNAIKLRLRSDVPVGSCLSGGIDSSAIVSIMGNLISGGLPVNLGGKLNVFTLTFDEKSIDESQWAKYVVDQTHAEWNLVKPTGEELLKDLRDMNYAQDIPVCSTGTYGQFQLMRRAKDKGIKVILDGQGGDELFGGYDSHSQVYWKELLRKGKIGRAISEMSADGKMGRSARMLLKDTMRRQFSSLLPFPVQRSILRSYFTQNEFLNESVIRRFVSSESMKQEMEVSRSGSLNGALLKDFVNTRLKMYLKYEDRSSMWHSIEARTPFADDHNLVEYVFNIPGTYKIHKGINKYLLREAARNFLPKQIKERKDKLGFVTPIDSWMKQIRNQLLEHLDDSVNEYMDVKKIKNDPDRFFRITGHAGGVRVFRMISFAVWKKLFNL